jgi:oxygen-independent coproporphyrinogen-3 oxidase
MAREVLQNVNLLKKYHHTTVYDYTEYPTKAFWSEDMKDQAYRDALTDWIPRSNGSPVLFYVHTPFCEELCYFCLCSKEITKDYARVTDYLYQHLFREIDLLREHFERHALRPNVTEIYFGGGSPTYYREPEFEALLGKLRTLIDFDQVKTFTVEVDPRRVDVDRLRFYHAMGVNRLSFGIQDFDPEVQKEINRIQPPEIVARLLTPEIRSYFPTINFDLLIGLPKQTPQSIRETIESVVALGPDQIQTMYVHYKPQVRKYMVRMVQNGPMPDFYDRKAIFVEATEGLLAAGYERAGFESFAKPDDVLAHSMGEQKAYYNSLGTTTGDATNFLSVGSSAHGVFGGEYYFQNYYEQDLYREALARGEFPIYRGYKLTPEDKLRADVIKRLRTYFRIDVAAIEDQWEIDFRSHFARELTTLQEFERDALVQFDRGGLALTDLGRHFAPQVASVFDSFLDRPAFNREVVVHGA